ncbi:TetR family transcriptional regulator [Corynebacterium sp. SCR221107]|uniref:TetR/AcrR family transcriptional regulator n=1 Tax=Corynebacterium sp. SCR221107 TaxID=3017361 RepID=UPI0022EC41DC|nr:TetR family transcriptional regulator [Corynebacterium sp. SCR221107]WBT08360.1 TetR family transcriptional regulator [Corynebacterium sp. SCR221107]
MRTNKKEQLLTTAIEIVDKHGLEALTYESLAEASGLSKSGLIYHFPSRYALLMDINRFLATQWRNRLVATAGADADSLDDDQRAAATLAVCSANATRADLLFALDASRVPEYNAVWDEVLSAWQLPRALILSDPRRYLIHLIGDGLWVHDHINGFSLSDDERRALVDAALELLG